MLYVVTSVGIDDLDVLTHGRLSQSLSGTAFIRL